MIDGRATPRYRVEEAAWIEYGGDKTPCTVRDLSETGALIEVSHTKSVPEKFTLIIPGYQLRLPSSVVRRSEFRIGVKFD
jgi:PilZ domain